MVDFLEVLATHPDDIASWSVYSDLLQTRGEPRGELMSVMLDREREPNARLLELQQRLIAKHGAAFAPHLEDQLETATWRRGFVHEIRIDDPELLAMLVDEKLIAAATLAIDCENWTDWCDAIAKVTLPWRRLRIELENCPDEVLVQPLLAGFPAVEALRLRPDRATTFTWREVKATRLATLTLVDARVVDLDTNLPALRELRLCGESSPSPVLCASALWRQLVDVVVPNDVEDAEGPTLHIAQHIERDTETESNAFFLTGRPIDLAVVQKLAARWQGDLSVRIAHVATSPRPITVIQMYGSGGMDLPYDLAAALAALAPSPLPIVLVEVSEVSEVEAGRFLALPTTRGGFDDNIRVIRRAVDLAIGCDPGADIHDQILEALAIAPCHVLVGAGHSQTILNMIDPQVEPLIVPEQYDDDDEDEDEDEGDWDDGEPSYPVDEAPVIAVEDLVADRENYEPSGSADDLELTLELLEPDENVALDQPDSWAEYREHWDDRALDPDNEPDEYRVPDPEEIVLETSQATENLFAPPWCAVHQRALIACAFCDLDYCPECDPLRTSEDCCMACATSLRLPIDPVPVRHPG